MEKIRGKGVGCGRRMLWGGIADVETEEFDVSEFHRLPRLR